MLPNSLKRVVRERGSRDLMRLIQFQRATKDITTDLGLLPGYEGFMYCIELHVRVTVISDCRTKDFVERELV